MIYRELSAVIMPNGSLQLEWTDTEDTVSKSQKLLQEEVYSRFVSGADSWLLFLCFSDNRIPLSPSLSFLRNFIGLFAKKLIQTPDLEILRHKVEISITGDELAGSLDNGTALRISRRHIRAARKLKQLQKKNPNIKPILLEGHSIARTWWAKAWNVNLERYADYSNRIGRGRSYVRNGAVLDLQIKPGEVTALIQGTARNPYTVIIKIKRLSAATWKDIRRACEGRLDSLQELLMGEFPKTLGELFTAKGKGLFPSPKEIEFSCSCPDWAYMCKHVAATLYGISARLVEKVLMLQP